jgi:hypothetical protein
MEYSVAASQTWLMLWGWHSCLQPASQPARRRHECQPQAGLPAPQKKWQRAKGLAGGRCGGQRACDT